MDKILHMRTFQYLNKLVYALEAKEVKKFHTLFYIDKTKGLSDLLSLKQDTV